MVALPNCHTTLATPRQALKRKLAARKAFVPWGGGKFVPLKLKVPTREPLLETELGEGAPAAPAAAPAAPAVVLPPGVEPLVLWEPPAGVEGQPVRVDDMLTQVGGQGRQAAPLLLLGGMGGVHAAALAWQVLL